MATIWITGGKGFIGRHLARLASLEGNRVCGIGHGLWPAEEAEKWGYADWCNGEIEAANLSQLAQRNGLPDAVYHLAAAHRWVCRFATLARIFADRSRAPRVFSNGCGSLSRGFRTLWGG